MKTILFCDLHDFSRLVADIDGSALAFIDSFYQSCGECIVSRGGRIIKYIGDSMLATFGEDGVEEAVQAARCMRSEYAALVAGLDSSVASDMEIGISLGETEEGEVGHPSLRTFDVFGECVNEAAIMCHYRGIAITAAVKERLPDRYSVKQLPAFNAKWRSEPLAAWAVVDG